MRDPAPPRLGLPDVLVRLVRGLAGLAFGGAIEGHEGPGFAQRPLPRSGRLRSRWDMPGLREVVGPDTEAPASQKDSARQLLLQAPAMLEQRRRQLCFVGEETLRWRRHRDRSDLA